MARARASTASAKRKASVPSVAPDMVRETPRLGRPPDYDEEHHCARIVELGAMGYSQARMAADIGVCKATITQWAQKHPAFSNALSRARTLSQAHWEAKGYENLSERNFNTPLYLGSMKSMFRDDYMDRTASEITGKDGAPIEMKDVSDIEAARRIAYALGRAVGRGGQAETAENATEETA